MTLRCNVIFLTVVAALCSPAGVNAGPVSLVDTTPGTATRDGSVGPGEYVASSSGINTGFGGVMGSASLLHVDSSTGGTLNFGLELGGGTLGNFAAIYIDSVGGGVDGTAGLTDTGDLHRRMVSGTSPNSSSDLSFAPGFKADYAVAFDSSYGGVWRINAGGSHEFIDSVVITSSVPGASWEMELDLSDIGLLPGQAFKYVTSYADVIAGGGNDFYRSDEFHGVAGSTVPSGNPGTNAVVLVSGDYNTFRSYGSAPDAGPVTIEDRTAEGAIVDGMIGSGEYAGSSAGINRGFDNVFGDQSQVYVDSSVDGTLNFGLHKGPGSFNDHAVIYIDSVAGGITNTTGLTDNGALRQMISGVNNNGRTILKFGAGFEPDYAITLLNSGAWLFRLVEGDPLEYKSSPSVAVSGDIMEFALNLADIGAAPGAGIRYLLTYGNPDPGDGGKPYRADEFHGVAGSTVTNGNPGTNTVVLSAGDFNRFTTIGPTALVTILIVR